MLAAGGVWAHEKGDLTLNIEPQMGAVFPAETLMENDMAIGFGMSLRTTVDYYFLDFLAANAGLGVGFNHHMFEENYYTKMDKQAFMQMVVAYYFLWPFFLDGLLGGKKNVNYIGEFFAAYIIIPFGLRFSKSAFTLGAGLTANIPISDPDNYLVYKPVNKWGQAQDDIRFKLLPYMGWYADIGFDLSNKKRPKNAFGMVLRLNGAFNKEIAEPDSENFRLPPDLKRSKKDDWIKRYRFDFISLDLVFRFSIGLANLPIGGKK